MRKADKILNCLKTTVPLCVVFCGCYILSIIPAMKYASVTTDESSLVFFKFSSYVQISLLLERCQNHYE